MFLPSYIVSAQVKSTDPENHAVYVQLLQQGNESPVLPCRIMVHGQMDGLRITQRPLPGRGTVGLVCAVNGDPRSLVWLGAIAANGQDAITSGPGNDFFHYESRYSGWYDYHDEAGNSATQWPDGTLVTIGASAAPQLYCHRIGTSGTRTRQAISRQQQISNPPGPMSVVIQHSTGTSVEIATDGDVNVSGVANINVATENGFVNLGNLLNTVYRLVDERMVTLFNNHTHGGILPGGANTAVPNSMMAIGSETTLVTFAN